MRKDRELSTLKQQVLDMSDKFDYFICMMLKGKKLSLEDIAEQKSKLL